MKYTGLVEVMIESDRGSKKISRVKTIYSLGIGEAKNRLK